MSKAELHVMVCPLVGRRGPVRFGAAPKTIEAKQNTKDEVGRRDDVMHSETIGYRLQTKCFQMRL